MPILTTLGAACAKAWGFTSGLVKDQYFNLVSLLLPGNGTNGAQNNTFLDGSSNNFTITRNGNTTQGTFSPFSQTGWGGYFNGSSSLTPSSGSFLALGTSNYTIEFWIYLTQNVGNNHALAINANNGLVVVISATKTSLNQYGVGDLVATGSGLSVNTWNHVAIVRAGTGTNQTSIYINGSRSVQGTDATNWTVTTNPRIGGNITDQYIYGYISNVRVVTSAIYSGASITVPTTPLTAISGTTFLTLQNNRFLDNGSTAATFTTTGSPSVVAFSPFAPTAAYTTAAVGGSGYFDGTRDYLTLPSTSNLAFGTGDFSIEAWVYPTSVVEESIIANTTTSGAGDTQLVFYIFNNKLSIGGWFTNFLIGSTNVSVNAWSHVVVCRTGTTMSLFLNGARDATGTVSNNFSSTNAFFVGAYPSGTGGDFNGYITNLRVLKGSSAYDPTQTSITIPTAPPTAITNTQLLLNFTNAGITDATAKNDLETVGNAQISTSVSKFGGGSIAFDGTGDYLLTNGSVTDLLAFGTGDFCIEMWVNFNSLSGTPSLLDARPASTNGAYVFLYASASGIDLYVSSAVRIAGTVSLSTGVWYHVAVARSSGSTRLYVAGNQVGSTYSDTTSYLGATGRPAIGTSGSVLGNDALNGYIDDLRITKGNARGYTGSTITVPTAPFPVQ